MKNQTISVIKKIKKDMRTNISRKYISFFIRKTPKAANENTYKKCKFNKKHQLCKLIKLFNVYYNISKRITPQLLESKRDILPRKVSYILSSASYTN